MGEGQGSKGDVFSIVGLIYAVLRAFDANATDNQAAETNRKIANSTTAVAWLTGALVVTSVLSIAVLYSQWGTFKKTDRTLRGSERAFIYLSAIRPERVESNIWAFMYDVANNGTTQATNVNYFLRCNSNVARFDSFFMGPKEVTNVGSCPFAAGDLNNMRLANQYVSLGGTFFYQDIFSDWHWTKFCRMIKTMTDPQTIPPGGTLPILISRCQGDPDCADRQCEHK